MTDVVLLKLGGSLITDKTREETPRREVIGRLAGEIAQALKDNPCRLVVAHGSGSFGHVAAQRHGIGRGPLSAEQLAGACITQERAAALHRIVVAALLEAGARPFSLAPSSCVVALGGRPVEIAFEPLLLALERGLLPVLYGDVVLDREWGASICSTERLFRLLAPRLQNSGLLIRGSIWLGETDGLWDAAGRTVPQVTAATFADALKAIGAPAGTDVTGGMRHRLETALELAGLGIPSLLANGLTPGLLEKALHEEKVIGTEVV
ncbi:MAG TPA: isopentenyl phosphate kinase [Thermoanaerobaculia bacterium]|jgi:isopentenyl phosphate kinase|nr:isopentenyl phosphate kinase [Thermoanaerobaculia bacterium]